MKLNDNITVIKDLGAGAFGQVYLCKYQKDGFSKEVAVKKVNNQDNKEKVIKEALLNSELNHPNIVQIYNVEFDSNNNILFIYEYV
jgi:serine/threonine protein kinase